MIQLINSTINNSTIQHPGLDWAKLWKKVWFVKEIIGKKMNPNP